MVNLIVENIESEKYDINNRFIAVNAIKATIGEAEFEFPSPAPIKSELDAAIEAKEEITPKLFQYFYQIQERYPLTRNATCNNITTTFKKLIADNPSRIGDICFDFLSNHEITSEERDAILKIQRDSDSLFLSDIETNKEQDTAALEAEIDSIDNPKDQIVCPTLDLSTVTPGVFSAKLDFILERKFPRVNVKFASLDTYYVNWLDLAERIYKKDIWCNLTSIPRGYFNADPPFKSLLACVFLYGVHTASHNYPRRPKKNKDEPKKEIKKDPSEWPSRLLNRNTLYFDDSSLSYYQSRVRSINNQHLETNLYTDLIKGKTFFAEYSSKKKALTDELHDLEGRM